MKNNLIKLLFSNTLANGLNFISRWLANYGLSRYMSLSGFGVFSFILSLSNLFKSIFSFGSQLFLIYKVSREQKLKYYHYLQSIVLSLIFSGVLFVLLISLKLFEPKFMNVDHFLFAVLLASFMVLIQNTYAFFKGVGLFQKEAWGYVLYLSLLIAFLCVLYTNIISADLFNVLIVIMLLHLFLCLFSFFQLYRYYNLDHTDEKSFSLFDNIQVVIKERAPYGFHELQSALYLNAIIIIMGFLVEDKDLAIYRSIQIIIVPVSIFPMIFSQVLLKKLTDSLDDRIYSYILFRRFIFVSFIIGILLVLLLYFRGDWVVNLFYGDKFITLDYIDDLLLIFSITYFFRFVSANYGVLITARNKQKIRVYATSALIVVTIVSTFFLTNSMGIIGAAYANAISYLFIMIVYVVYSEINLLRK